MAIAAPPDHLPWTGCRPSSAWQWARSGGAHSYTEIRRVADAQDITLTAEGVTGTVPSPGFTFRILQFLDAPRRWGRRPTLGVLAKLDDIHEKLLPRRGG